MSGISKFKRIYSEGVAKDHSDLKGQPEFANKADEILARRKKDRAQSGKNAKLDAIGRKLYNMNKIGEETELDEKIDVGSTTAKDIFSTPSAVTIISSDMIRRYQFLNISEAINSSVVGALMYRNINYTDIVICFK